MKKEMPGFMIYFNDWDMPRQIMDAEEFKEFFDAVFEYARDGILPPESQNSTVQVFFECFREKINTDTERYRSKCEKASEAAKKSHAKQSHANAANTNTNTNPNTNRNTNSNTNIRTNTNPYPYEYQNDRMQTQDDDLYPPDQLEWFEEKLREAKEEGYYDEAPL